MKEEPASAVIEKVPGFGNYIKVFIKSKGIKIRDFAAQVNTSEYGQKYNIDENRVYKILEDVRIPNIIEYYLLIEMSGADPEEAYKRLQRFVPYAVVSGLFTKSNQDSEDDEDDGDGH